MSINKKVIKTHDKPPNTRKYILDTDHLSFIQRNGKIELVRIIDIYMQ